MRFIVKISSVSLFAFLLSSCSTPQHQALRRVEVGMDKAAVLGLAGNPTRTSRQHGLDRWTYEVDGDSGRETTYVFFDQGKVSYAGPTQENPGVKKTPASGEKATDFKTVGE